MLNMCTSTGYIQCIYTEHSDNMLHLLNHSSAKKGIASMHCVYENMCSETMFLFDFNENMWNNIIMFLLDLFTPAVRGATEIHHLGEWLIIVISTNLQTYQFDKKNDEILSYSFSIGHSIS